VRKYWRQTREALVRRLRYRVTRGGLLFSLALLAIASAAVVSTNNLLFLIAAAMLATMLVSGLVSRLCLAALELDFQVPDHVPAGRTVPAKLFVRNSKWLTPSFSIRIDPVRDPNSPTLKSGVYFPVIAGRAILEETVEVRFPRRGAYRQNTFAFSTAFPFGFLEKSARVTLRRDMIVYPSIDPKPGFDDLLAGVRGEMETHYRGLGRDFYRIRPYEALESAKHVDWKATAHVGSLQVREFAREEEQTLEVFLDRNAPPEFDAWFEEAVDCCAFLCWRLSNQGISVHFRSQGYDFRQPEDGDIYAILRYLALTQPQPIEGVEPPFEETSYKMVFTPSPSRYAEAGWMGARMLGPDLLSCGPADARD
jgi:uncharacterized protein (DUF58 family)